MTLMKKYFLLSLILIAVNAHAQDPKDKVTAMIQSFPYGHRPDADAALTTMNAWERSDWKAIFKLLDDDSLKVKATYALSLYVNTASLDPAKKSRAIALLNKYSTYAKSEYAQSFIRTQSNLLADTTIINQQNAGLPPLPAYTLPPATTSNGEQELLLLEDNMALAQTPIEKRRILAKAANIPGFSSFILVSKSLKDEAVNKDAALILTRLALGDETIKGPVVREALQTALPLIHGEDSAILTNKLTVCLRKMPYDHGFAPLFDGVDLEGWKALVGNPITRSKMTGAELRAAQKAADEKTKGDWIVKDGLLVFTGHGENLATAKQYSDIEMYVDWKITEKGDAGIYLRGSPQVQIWDTSRREVGAQVGSGGLYNNQKNESKPLVVADNKIGEWNRFHIIMKGEKVTVWLNGTLVTDNIALENYWDRSMPIFPKEQIELQAHGTYVAYRNIYLRELPTSEPSALTEAEKKEGFVSLFNGTDLNQWTGNTTGYPVRDGAVEVAPELGGGGNLYTKDEYANFIYRFEFQLTPGANNGIGIRAPLEGDAAYVGMEIQVLDNEAPQYKDLDPRQYHGSVYGIMPAKRGFLLPTGEWNKEEIIAKGHKIKVTLNGTVILDGDIKEAFKNGTLDNKDHPGLFRPSGHLGFLGHGDVVRFRNMRVKKLQ
jgi:hypothetical protein